MTSQLLRTILLTLKLTVAFTLLMVALTTTFTLVAAADEEDGAAGQTAVENGRQALDASIFPWYDAETDGVRRIEVKEDEVAPAPTQRTGSSSFNFAFAWGDWFTPLAWVGLGTILVLLVVLLVRGVVIFVLRYKSDSAEKEEGEVPVRDVVDRVEDLPVRIRRPNTNLLSEARAQYDAGNYAEAIIYLYSHQLVWLDKQQLIRLTKGKTNRQYLYEIAALNTLRDIVEQTMVIFEDVFFGKRGLTRNRFELAWNQLDEFDRLVQEASK